jgi:pimeloyl-ACP methyl ester carboxylesterase
MMDQPRAWVGYAVVDGSARSVRLSGALTAPGVVSMDIPDLRVFGVQVVFYSGSDGEIGGRVTIGGQAARLAGRTGAGVFVGQLTADSGDAGAFMLRPEKAWDVADCRRLSGGYEIAGGRRISIHVSADFLDSPMLFYSEGDRLVRLYPDASGALISEAAEAFTLNADRSGITSVQLAGAGDRSQAAAARRASWSEEQVAIAGPAGMLAGTLMKPLGAGPHPAIVLIHGAAGGLRDVYRAFGEHFVQAGMAALVYDKRGHGGSAGGADPTFAQKSMDAEAWVDYLQTRADIRASRVGLWGFSNGSWVAPLVAARRPDVAFVAVIGATGATVIETEIHRRMFDLHEQGVVPAQVEQVADLWRLVYDLMVSREPDPQHAQRFDQLSAAVRASQELASIALQPYAIKEPFLGPLPPWRSYKNLVDDLAGYPDEPDEWTLDPVDSYEKIRVPVLFLVGDSDSNLPGPYSAQRVAKALHQAGNHNATVLVFPGTGHLMNLVDLGPDSGMTSEEAGYRLHHFRFAGGFRDIVRLWATSQALAPADPNKQSS